MKQNIGYKILLKSLLVIAKIISEKEQKQADRK